MPEGFSHENGFFLMFEGMFILLHPLLLCLLLNARSIVVFFLSSVFASSQIPVFFHYRKECPLIKVLCEKMDGCTYPSPSFILKGPWFFLSSHSSVLLTSCLLVSLLFFSLSFCHVLTLMSVFTVFCLLLYRFRNKHVWYECLS